MWVGRKKWLGLLLVTPLLVAMGGGGSMPSSDSIPRPKEKFTADLVDRQGVVTRVGYLSCNGRTFFPLERGEGTLMVPFAKVNRLRLSGDKGAAVEASVQAEGGKVLEGKLPRALAITGTTDFGNYQVDLGGLKEILLVR